MKSILLGFLAAVIGCIIFFLCLAGWYEMTGQGSGVAKRASSGDTGAVVVVAQDTAGQGSGGGSGTISQGSGTGTGSGSDGGTGTGSAQGSGNGTGAGSAQGSGSDTAQGSDANAGTGTSSGSAQTPGSISEQAINNYIEIIKNELSADLGEKSHVNVERSARGITISLWEDELVTKLSEGQKDDSTDKLWQEKKDQLRRISQTYAGRSASAGVTNAHVTANLLNERNQNDIILSYEDGTLIHDGLDHD